MTARRYTALYEEGGGQHAAGGAALAFAEGGIAGSLALICVGGGCETSGSIVVGGAIVNGLVGAGQGGWDYSESNECHSTAGYAKVAAVGAGQGAIPSETIWKAIVGGADG